MHTEGKEKRAELCTQITRVFAYFVIFMYITKYVMLHCSFNKIRIIDEFFEIISEFVRIIKLLLRIRSSKKNQRNWAGPNAQPENQEVIET